jgi:competence protein ComEA
VGENGVEEELDRPEWSTRWQQLRADRRVAAALLACIAVAAAAAWVRTSFASSSPAPAPPAPTTGDGTPTSRAPSASSSPAEVYVHVVGAVRTSGVVRLRAGARVLDAITAAGGANADADLARLNLAAPVSDGSRVAVPRVGQEAPPLDPSAVSATPGTPGSGQADNGPVNLNTASPEQLDALPGIGPATASAIVADREANGPFASVEDLLRVRGIGEAKLAQLRDLATV